MMQILVVAFDEERADLARGEDVDDRSGVDVLEHLAVRRRGERARERDEAAHVELPAEARGVPREHVEVERIGLERDGLVQPELVEHARHDRLGPERRVLPRVEVKAHALEAILVRRIAGAARAGAALGDPQHSVLVRSELARDRGGGAGIDRQRPQLLRAPPGGVEEDADAHVAGAGLDDGELARRELGLHVAPLGQPRLRQRQAKLVAGEQGKCAEGFVERGVLRRGDRPGLRIEGDGGDRRTERADDAPRVLDPAQRASWPALSSVFRARTETLRTGCSVNTDRYN